MTLTEHDKAQIDKIKPNTKIEVLSPQHSEYIQKLAFEAGFEWYYGGKIVQHADSSALFFWDDDKIAYAYNTISFREDYDGMKEIFIDLPPKEPKIAEFSPSSGNRINPPFKFRNANLPVVREWLKDHGYSFKNKNMDIMTARLGNHLGRVDEHGYFWCCSLLDNEYISIYHKDLPELIFNIETKIASVSIDNTAEITKLESELEVLRVKADEVREKLVELKS